MARYRSKDEIDLAWNELRRAATARIRLKYKAAEERELNEVLSELWVEFSKSLSQGEIAELDPEYKTWVADALTGVKTVTA